MPAPTIDLKISGEENNGQHFDEPAHVLRMRRGGILFETVRDLEKARPLQIVHERSNRMTSGSVAWVSRKSDGRAQVLVEVDDAANFWREVVGGEVREESAWRMDRVAGRMAAVSGGVGASTSSVAVALSASPPAPHKEIQTLHLVSNPLSASPEQPSSILSTQPSAATEPQAMSAGAQLTEVLNDLVKSTLEANAGPLLETITLQIREIFAQAQIEFQSSLEASVQRAAAGFSARLSMETEEAANRNERALDQKFQRVNQHVDQGVKFLHGELRKKLDDLLSHGTSRMEQELAAVISRAGNAETELIERIERRAAGIEDRYGSEIKKSAEEAVHHAVKEANSQFGQWSRSTAERLHDTMIESIVGELVREHEVLALEARRLVQEETHVNTTRATQAIGRFVKELGETLEQRAEAAWPNKAASQ